MSGILSAKSLSSQPFLIHGPETETFYIHGELLASSSAVFAACLNSAMQEATIKIEAVDDDIDDDTVLRFIEFVYTGDYTSPQKNGVRISFPIGLRARTWWN
ncbi:hypothetical protein LTR05_002247 [Lithohypha guttulata]|uniref:BTB domain-containing protein n=1 Tax=Lithohypha guttulata TaxID=1690604 RepID=A0AAN7T222_9EURO|nr:hypothetical protein LTR05_002247 [Lithohypha guttulata]